MATPINNFPELEAAENQKYLVVNQAFRQFDGLLNLTVLNRTITAPPANPNEGERYIIGSNPTGTFVGHTNKVIVQVGGRWIFFTPQQGWRAYDQGANEFILYNGTSWGLLNTGGGGALTRLELLGINTTANTSARLRAETTGVEFVAETESIYQSLAKTSASGYCAVDFIDAGSNRARMGLIGNNNFSIHTGNGIGAHELAFQINQLTQNVGIKVAPHVLHDLLVQGSSILFNGTDDLAFIISKRLTAHDAAINFSSNNQVRATMGLLGDDNFAIETVANNNAIKIDRTTGHVGLGGNPDSINRLTAYGRKTEIKTSNSFIDLSLDSSSQSRLNFTQSGTTRFSIHRTATQTNFISSNGASARRNINLHEDGTVEFPNTPLFSFDGINSVSSGNTTVLRENLIAQQGQIGKTILAVGFVYHQGDAEGTAHMSAQITSLEESNVIFVYATGADFLTNTVQEGPVFLDKGEIYVVQNLRSGSIIIGSEGIYGYSNQRNGTFMSPMPLLSLALSFKESFFFAYRTSGTYGGGSTTSSLNQGWVHIVNGPVESTVKLTNGNRAVVRAQENITLAPWEYRRLYTDGNMEYILTSTNPVMACINAQMGTMPQFNDSRLIMPLTTDGITWPTNGSLSALHSGTFVKYYVNDNVLGDFTANPGSPISLEDPPPNGTGVNEPDYEPRGATRFRAKGLISAFSAADGQGSEATPLCPINFFTQRIALPLRIRNFGSGASNGISLASIYTGTAHLYQWDPVSGVTQLVEVLDPSNNRTTEIRLIRRNNSTGAERLAANRVEQFYPASCLISPSGGRGGSDPNSYRMLNNFNGGYIEVDVPSMCVFNSEQNETGTVTEHFRGTGGDNVNGIFAARDEQLSFGISPEYFKTQIFEDASGLLRKRQINSAGVETWEPA